VIVFDRTSVIRLLYSMFIATLITLFALAMSGGYTEAVLYILKGMLAGAVIWLLAEVLFTLCEWLYPRSPLPGYVVLAFLILVGTAGFGYLFGFTDIAVLGVMCLAAEACGIGITVFYRKKYIRELNEKLARSKEEL
jgi:hypothetical protein